MLLRGEINYFVRSLRHYPVLIFPHLLSSLLYAQFSDIKCGTKLKSKNYITVFTSHVKTRHKNIALNLFEHMHYQNFLSSSSDLMQPRIQSFFSL